MISAGVLLHSLSGMRHRFFVHIGWTTRDRAPTLDLPRAQFLMTCLPTLALRERCRLLEFGIVSTHVHLFGRLNPMSNIPRLLQLLKGSSATFARRDHNLPIEWARGYNIETVSPSSLTTVHQYVRNQAVHHPKEAIHGFMGTSTG